jgi:hypothetical protein
VGSTWPVISQSNSIRTAASCLLDARRRVLVLQALDICSDIEWPDRGQCEAAMFAPGKEPGARPGIGAARVGVANVGGEEFDITPARVIADVGDHPCFDRPEPVNLRSYLTTASKSGSGMGSY